MAWSAISCSLRSDPRLFVIDRRSAFAAVCAAYLFSSEHETDGLVPRAVLEEFAPAIVVDQLIRDGVLTDVGGDVEVVAFLDTNPTHAAREMMREKDRAKKRAVRCPRGTPDGTPDGTHQGIPQGTPSVRPPATGQDNTTQHSTLISAPSERPETAAPEPPGKRGRGGKGKTRQLLPASKEARSPSIPQAIWNYFATRYQDRHGEKPLAQSHFFVQLDRRVKAGLTLEQGRARVDRYFDAPPFALRDGARDFGRLLSRWDMLAPEGLSLADRMPEGPPPIYVDPSRRDHGKQSLRSGSGAVDRGPLAERSTGTGTGTDSDSIAARISEPAKNGTHA